EGDGDRRLGHVLHEPDRRPEGDPDDEAVNRNGHGESHPRAGAALALLGLDQIFFEHALSSRPWDTAPTCPVPASGSWRDSSYAIRVPVPGICPPGRRLPPSSPRPS